MDGFTYRRLDYELSERDCFRYPKYRSVLIWPFQDSDTSMSLALVSVRFWLLPSVTAKVLNLISRPPSRVETPL